jgi:hypothetical protein
MVSYEKDLDNIILECDYEKNYKYEPPSDMINKDGSKNYAYATLVMLGDLYISAAIVLAQSLIKLNTKADLVVLVTNDVSENGKKILRQFYDKVIEVKYITVKNWRVKKQPHRKYLEYVFTKFHIFDLTQYKKILLIDADAIILKHPDHLFSLNAPAGCYLKDKDLFISYDKFGNYVLPTNDKIKWYDEMCRCCGHGKSIPKEETDKVLKDKNNAGIGGGLMLLEPKKGELDDILKDVTKGRAWQLVSQVFAWPEQQYLTYRYSGKWTGINPRFFGLQGYPHWKVLYGLQYGGDKPFMLSSKFSIETRLQYPDYILWHKLFREILIANPSFMEAESLKEAVKMNKYYNLEVSVRRQTIDYKQYDYMPTKIKPLFDKIAEYDYFTPIFKLEEYFKNSESNYYKLLSKKVSQEQQNQQKILNDYNLTEDEKDIIMLNYIQSRPSIFIVTLWTVGIKYLDEIVNYLKKNGNVYYYKTIELTYNGIKNLMLMMYDQFSRETRKEFIEKKLNYIRAHKILKNKIGIIVFDNVMNKNIGGQNSEFKREMRNFLTEKVRNDIQLKEGEEIRGNDVIHINDFFYQSCMYSQSLFNKNTLNLFDKQLSDRFLNSKWHDWINNINILKEWLYNNLSLLEINRLCLLGGSILSCYGIRPGTDIDAILINNDITIKTSSLNNLINKYFIDEETKFAFADIGLEYTKYWRESWTTKNNEILKIFNINNFTEVLLNPKYHFYYNGIKFYLLDFEIARKFLRFKVQDYADFVILYLKHKNIIDNSITVDSNMHIKLPEYAQGKKLMVYDGTVYQYTLDVIKKKYLPEDYKDITVSMIKTLLSAPSAPVQSTEQAKLV